MVWQKKYNYYNTKKVKAGGRAYDSKFEAGYGMELEMLKKKGEIRDFKTHQTKDLICNGYRIGEYQIDFEITHNDGIIEFVETKGWPTEVWKYKWKIFCSMYEDNPKYRITLIMQKGKYNPRMRKIK